MSGSEPGASDLVPSGDMVAAASSAPGVCESVTGPKASGGASVSPLALAGGVKSAVLLWSSVGTSGSGQVT